MLHQKGVWKKPGIIHGLAPSILMAKQPGLHSVERPVAYSIVTTSENMSMASMTFNDEV